MCDTSNNKQQCTNTTKLEARQTKGGVAGMTIGFHTGWGEYTATKGTLFYFWVQQHTCQKKQMLPRLVGSTFLWFLLVELVLLLLQMFLLLFIGWFVLFCILFSDQSKLTSGICCRWWWCAGTAPCKCAPFNKGSVKPEIPACRPPVAKASGNTGHV